MESYHKSNLYRNPEQARHVKQDLDLKSFQWEALFRVCRQAHSSAIMLCSHFYSEAMMFTAQRAEMSIVYTRLWIPSHQLLIEMLRSCWLCHKGMSSPTYITTSVWLCQYRYLNHDNHAHMGIFVSIPFAWFRLLSAIKQTIILLRASPQDEREQKPRSSTVTTLHSIPPPHMTSTYLHLWDTKTRDGKRPVY